MKNNKIRKKSVIPIHMLREIYYREYALVNTHIIL
jgi:hypothetical protein